MAKRNDDGAQPVATRPHETAPASPNWWNRPWVMPLWVITAIFLVWRVPNYLGFTPEASIVPLRTFSHYLLLSAHVVTGAVTLACCCLQVWPWLRNNHPRVHRISGRIYVIAVLPASLLALASSVTALTTPPSGRWGNILLSVIWLGTTIAGYRAIRTGDVNAHQRWMIRSFALCFSIVVNRLWIGIAFAALLPFADTYYQGDIDSFVSDVAVFSIWSSWTTNLLIAEWWIERKQRRRPTRGRKTLVVGQQSSQRPTASDAAKI